MKSWETVEECVKDLDSLENSRDIRFAVVHHTFSPNHSEWDGDRSAEGILNYWLAETKRKGWRNPLGANFIVSPGGKIYMPFSIGRVVNANSDVTMNHYAISIETVGNFDTGHDVLRNPQRHALYGLLGGILATFGLPEERVRYHREFNPSKTCPGTSMNLEETRRCAAIAKAWAKNLLKGG